jgi:hypothetical protein
VRLTSPRWWTQGIWLHATETASATVSPATCPRNAYQSADRCRLRLEGTESEAVVEMHVIPSGPTAIVEVALTGENMVDADPSNDVVIVRLEAVPPATLPLRFNGTLGDEIIEGSRNDLIAAREEFRDLIVCGPGRDRVIADPGDVVARDCELVTRR